MSHLNIIKLLKSKHKQINMEGTITSLFTLENTQMISVLIAIVMTHLYYIYYLYHKKHPITLYCNSLYSHFTEQLLILNKLPYYKIYKPFINNITYYTSSKKKTVNINPFVTEWMDEMVTLQPLSMDELLLISNHVKLPVNLVITAQEKVLALLPEINAYHIVRENYLEDEIYTKQSFPINQITKGFHSYKIESNHKMLYTNLILSDAVELYIGDVINGFYYSCVDEEVYTENKYIVNTDYQLEPLNKKLKKEITALPFYNLETPRLGIKIHPFHLPKSKDPILSLLILTQVLIDL